MFSVNFIMLGYIGPETMLPAASALAAITGVVMMGWRYILGLIKKGFSLVFHRHAVAEQSVRNDSASNI